MQVADKAIAFFFVEARYDAFVHPFFFGTLAQRRNADLYVFGLDLDFIAGVGWWEERLPYSST